MIRIVFLGKLADLAGVPEMEAAGPLSWAGLLGVLSPELAEAAGDEKTKLALDGKLLADKTALDAHDGSEIALLPPVSGG